MEDQINQKEHERKWAIPFNMRSPLAPSVLRSFEFYPLEHGTKKKSESPTGIKPMTPQTPDRHYLLSYKNSRRARSFN